MKPEQRFTARTVSVFFVGDWSVPELVEVNSAAGPAKLLRKTCEVCLQRAGRETRYKFDVLWDPDKPTVWAGERRPFYYLLGQTICGSSIEGWHLVVKRSRTVDRFGDLTFEGYIQTELAKFVADPSAAKGPLNADAVFTLDKIFTFNSILPSRSATTHSPFVTVTDPRVDPQGATFAMTTKVGKKLTLTLDANLELVSATCDNVPVLVLMTRTGSSWAGPTQITVPSENGNIIVLSCNWAVVEKADNGDEIEKEAFRAVVAPDTGAVWIGPLFCRLVYIDGRFIGIEVHKDTSTLRLYASRKTKVQIGRDSARTFAAELARFEAEYKSGVFKPDATYKLAELLRNTPAQERITEPSIREVSCSPEGAMAKLNLGAGDSAATVLIHNDLSVTPLSTLAKK